ncbi:DUF4153 domain-containing protein [Haloglycomyces albus]|uniref:DUF4153 domain-containing protein n=1 Tax=Haloglycomyces albus TaxID=526067 RepID=UPI00146FA541|nr:DUF4173 domain-containing protein [Haloglycomyces albus]
MEPPTPGYPTPPHRNSPPTDHRAWWNGPESSASPLWIPGSIALQAVLAAFIAFPGVDIGIGLALIGILSIAIPTFVARHRLTSFGWTAAALSAALWAMVAVRDANWLAVLCALTAIALTPIALSQPRRFTGFFRSVFETLSGCVDAANWTTGSFRSRIPTGSTGRVGITVLITMGLLVVFTTLFAYADPDFAALILSLIPQWDIASFTWSVIVAGLVAGSATLWAYMAASRSIQVDRDSQPRQPVSLFEFALPLAALNILFFVFVGVQAGRLFGGSDRIGSVEELTVASYARTGFAELGFASALTLAVIVVAAWKAPTASQKERLATRVLLGGICVLTLLVVASAIQRMTLYFDAFGLTRLRLTAFAGELWIGGMFVLLLACLWRLRANWLHRGVVLFSAAILLGLALINPDRFIAQYNIDHQTAGDGVDAAYLSGLSHDAIPAIMDIEDEELRECVISMSDWEDNRPFTAGNLGYWLGRNATGDGSPTSSTCPRSSSPDDQAVSPPVPTDRPTSQDDRFFIHNCPDLPLRSAETYFGRDSAKGYDTFIYDYGNSHAMSSDLSQEPYLHCAYTTSNDGTVTVSLKQWPSADEALQEFSSIELNEAESNEAQAETWPEAPVTGLAQDEGDPTVTAKAIDDDHMTVEVGISGHDAADEDDVRQAALSVARDTLTDYMD